VFLSVHICLLAVSFCLYEVFITHDADELAVV